MLYQHQITQIGSFHKNHCEDYTFSGALSENRQVLAVFDGCTMGDESYFAAILFGRILRKLARNMFFLGKITAAKMSIEIQLKELMRQLFVSIQEIKNDLYLEERELLTTVTIGIVDTKKQNGAFLCVGDGLIVINGRFYEFDQGNQPDYLGYHLTEKFEDWYSSIQQRLIGNEIKDLSLSSDGVFTFVDQQDMSTSDYQKVLEYLLLDQSDLANPHFFQKKLRTITQIWGLTHTDDLGIVRCVLQE
ncbi:MAG: protein phosphatase 2C domain-containing protein [Bacteroidota bacterium]